MKRLLYCVFRVGDDEREYSELRGVDAAPVALVRNGELYAATSPVGEGPPVPTVERVMAHQAVVEAIFEEHAVVPMRFGSIVESESEVARFLAERASEFGARLRELSGCAEMGIRVLAAPARGSAEPSIGGARAARPPAPGPGHAYLRARAKTVRQDEAAVALGQVVERYRSALHGMYTRLEVESPTPVRLVVGPGGQARLEPLAEAVRSDELPPADVAQRGVLSLSFLVPIASLEAFRETFDRIGQETVTSRLSGPWPPYSFAAG